MEEKPEKKGKEKRALPPRSKQILLKSQNGATHKGKEKTTFSRGKKEKAVTGGGGEEH